MKFRVGNKELTEHHSVDTYCMYKTIIIIIKKNGFTTYKSLEDISLRMKESTKNQTKKSVLRPVTVRKF